MTMAAVYSFGSDFMLVGALLLWLVILLRAPVALRSTQQRRLLLAATGIAGSVTVYLDPVTAALNSTFVFANSCGLFMNIWGVASSALILDFVLAALDRRRPWLVYGWAAGVSVTLIALNATISPHAGCVSTVQAEWYSPFWWLLSAAHVVAVVPCAMLCARYAYRAQSAPTLRTGLALLAAGFASSAVFWGPVVLGVLLLRPMWLVALFPLNIGLTTWLIAAGIALPLVLELRQLAAKLRSLHGLDPLWRELVAAAPGVRLPEPGMRRWSTDLRLYRRVIEIRDAILILRDYVSTETVTRAREHALARGVQPDTVEATATACWLTVALAAKACGVTPEPAEPDPEGRRLGPGDDLSGEVDFLRSVSSARTSAVVATFSPARSAEDDSRPRKEGHR